MTGLFLMDMLVSFDVFVSPEQFESSPQPLESVMP